MNATSARQKPIGPSATSMNGRRLPIGVWKVSDHGPITGESASANSPSDPSTSDQRPRVGEAPEQDLDVRRPPDREREAERPEPERPREAAVERRRVSPP